MLLSGFVPVQVEKDEYEFLQYVSHYFKFVRCVFLFLSPSWNLLFSVLIRVRNSAILFSVAVYRVRRKGRKTNSLSIDDLHSRSEVNPGHFKVTAYFPFNFDTPKGSFLNDLQSLFQGHITSTALWEKLVTCQLQPVGVVFKNYDVTLGVNSDLGGWRSSIDRKFLKSSNYHVRNRPKPV